MKLEKILYVFLPNLFLLNSCFEPPVLPLEPRIQLKSFEFKETSASGFDSLIIEIHFEDGDGDLGLTTFDTLRPYNDFDFKTDNNGDYIKFDSGNISLPPLNCLDYEPVNSVDSNGKRIREYYLVDRNENHFNFFLDIYVKDADGNFKLYDFLVERCGPDLNASQGLHGRFFPLNTSDKAKTLEGTLRYRVESGFKLLFPNQILKLRIQIQDRALHRSNVVWTEEILLKV